MYVCMYAIRWQFASIRKTCKVDDTQVELKRQRSKGLESSKGCGLTFSGVLSTLFPRYLCAWLSNPS